jgi:hypothetical protein
MKLFYHFLFFVFTSLILVACANIFASDTQSKSKIDEFPAPESNNFESKDDSTIAINNSDAFAFTVNNLKVSTPLYTGLIQDNAMNFAYQKFTYVNNVQTALNYFGALKKFK